MEALCGSTILITGADGMLGRAFLECLVPLAARCRVIGLPREMLDVTDREAVLRCSVATPDIILHCAGNANADLCERQPEAARAVHVDGTVNVAELARQCGATVFYPQSVFIFDGNEVPVTESTRPSPGLAYGRLKLEAEERLLELVPDTLVIRMAGFFGGDEKDKNFVGMLTRQIDVLLKQGVRRFEVGNRIWQPTYTVDLARNTLLLLAERRRGIYHMGARGEATFFEVARACVEHLGLADRLWIDPCEASRFSAQEGAFRPMRMATATRRLEAEGLDRQRHWRDALREYLARPYFDRFRDPVSVLG